MKLQRKPFRIKKRKSILKSRFFWLIVFAFIIGGIVFYFIAFSLFFQVKKIIVTGEKEISEEALQSLVNKGMERKILFLKSESIFLTNLNGIKKEILNNFPIIAKVEITRDFPDVLKLTVTERSAIANYCGDSQCFLLDEEGVIFKESQEKENLTKITDKRNNPSFILGKQVFEKNYIEKILKIREKIEENLKIKIEKFIISSEQLNVKTVESWEIYFDPTSDIDWKLQELSLVLEKEIPPEKRGNLEYINLRFSRVYFKYR